MGRAWFLWTSKEGLSPPSGAGGAGSGHAGAGGGSSTMTGGSEAICAADDDAVVDEDTTSREGGPDEPLHPEKAIRAKRSAAIREADLKAAVIGREDSGRAGDPGAWSLWSGSIHARRP